MSSYPEVYDDRQGGPSPAAGLDAIVGLSLKIGDLVGEMQRQRRWVNEMRARLLPVDAPLAAAGNAPASGNLALDCGQPPQGQVWLLRNLYVGGTDAGGAAAGEAYVVVSALPSNQFVSAIPAASTRSIATSLPNVGTWTSRQIVVRYPERLHVVIKGGTSGDIYAVAGTAEQYDEAILANVLTGTLSI